MSSLISQWKGGKGESNVFTSLLRKKSRSSKPAERGNKTLLLIDWDNFFLCLYDRFRDEVNLEGRLEKLLEWVQSEVGELLDGRGFVFAPEHLNYQHQLLCVNNALMLITCPKDQALSDGSVAGEDTVDETLMDFGRMMAKHPDVGFVCLVSGDDDYVPFMKELGVLGIKRALAPPTINSLSKSKQLVRTVDEHSQTGKKMIFRLDQL